jgi:hypothetical protein
MKTPPVNPDVKNSASYKKMLDLAAASADSGYGHSGEQIFHWTKSWGKENETASPRPDIRPER